MPERPNLLSQIVKSRLNRASGMGLNGLAASSIGFVMLGCIAVGYFGGSWLDRKLGTTWAMPAGTFVGMLAGFVEMFRTLKQVAGRTKWPSSRGEPAATGSQKTAESARAPDATGVTNGKTVSNDEAAPVARQRLFNVPAPPLPEYDASARKVDEPSAAEVSARLHEDMDVPPKP